MADFQNGTTEDSTVPEMTNGTLPMMENVQTNGVVDLSGMSAATELPPQQIDYTNVPFVPTVPGMADPSINPSMNEIQTISAGGLDVCCITSTEH